MKDSTRSRVAAIVAAAQSRREVTSVFDYGTKSYRNLSAEVGQSGVSGFDYASRTHFSGGGGSLDFFDYETRAHVQLSLAGEAFSGFDYHTGKHYSGTVRSGSISVYDYETGRYYNYST